MDLSTKPKDLASSKAVQDLDTSINNLRQQIENLKIRIKALEDA
jgi:hypothetical protein